jgi:hypothetical protein
MQALEEETEGEKAAESFERGGGSGGKSHGVLPKRVSLLPKDFAAEQEATRWLREKQQGG